MQDIRAKKIAELVYYALRIKQNGASDRAALAKHTALWRTASPKEQAISVKLNDLIYRNAL
jgi:hypothetical protein